MRSDPRSQLEALPRISPIVERANQQLEALPLPEGYERQVHRLLSAVSQGSVALDNALQWLHAEDRAKFLIYAKQADQLKAEASKLDAELNANICTAPDY